MQSSSSGKWTGTGGWEVKINTALEIRAENILKATNKDMERSSKGKKEKENRPAILMCIFMTNKEYVII